MWMRVHSFVVFVQNSQLRRQCALWLKHGMQWQWKGDVARTRPTDIIAPSPFRYNVRWQKAMASRETSPHFYFYFFRLVRTGGWALHAILFDGCLDCFLVACLVRLQRAIDRLLFSLHAACFTQNFHRVSVHWHRPNTISHADAEKHLLLLDPWRWQESDSDCARSSTMIMTKSSTKTQLFHSLRICRKKQSNDFSFNHIPFCIQTGFGGNVLHREEQ